MLWLPFREIWQYGKDIVSHKKILFFLPLILDILIFGSLAFIPMPLIENVPKLAVPTALPSVYNLMPDIIVLVQERAIFTAIITGQFLRESALLIRILLFFILTPFLKAGYLGTIAQQIRETKIPQSFSKLASHNFLRIFIINLIVMFVPMLLIYPGYGLSERLGVIVLASLAIMLVLLLLYWEINVVYYDMQIFPALKKVVDDYRNNIKGVMGALIPLIILASVFSWMTTMFLGTILFLFIIVSYAYLAAVFVSGLMKVYVNLVQKDMNIIK